MPRHLSDDELADALATLETRDRRRPASAEVLGIASRYLSGRDAWEIVAVVREHGAIRLVVLRGRAPRWRVTLSTASATWIDEIAAMCDRALDAIDLAREEHAADD